MGVLQNIMRRTLCAVIQPDHFKFASYGPETTVKTGNNFAGSLSHGFPVIFQYIVSTRTSIAVSYSDFTVNSYDYFL